MIVAIPFLVAGMLSIRRHYLAVAIQLKQIPRAAPRRPHRVLVLVAHPDEATDRALRFAELLRAEVMTVVHAAEPDSDDVVHAWDRLYPDHPLEIIPGEDEPVVQRLIDRVRRERAAREGARVTVVVSERLRRRSWLGMVPHTKLLLLKARLLFEPWTVVTDLTLLRRRAARAAPRTPVRRIESTVLVSDLTRPIREALAYAEVLGDNVRAVHIDVDDAQRHRLEEDWAEAGYPHPLDIVPSPYREIGRPLVQHIRERRRQNPPDTVINVVIPEFIVPGRLGQLLHNQTGLAIKAVLAPEPRVAVTSVPFHLEHARTLHEARR